LMFDGKKERSIREIRDGTSNTIMLLEADDEKAVPWTKPEDWTFNAKKPLAGLGNAHPGGFNTAFADGSVHFISAEIDGALFEALLTIAGGEPVNRNEF
jgi:prepilin-type processing-associated H-X9-DG protein